MASDTPTTPVNAFYRSQVPPTASQAPGSKIFTSMFDKYMVAPSSRDSSTYLVFPCSYSDSYRDEEIDGSFKDEEDWEGIQWSAGIYEHLGGEHPKLLAYKGRDPYGYLLAKSSLGPFNSLLYSHSPLHLSPQYLPLIYRWGFNTMSALQYLHSRDVVHYEFCHETLWVEPDLSLSLIGLWGAHIGHYCPTSGNHMASIGLEETLPSWRTDVFDWATWIYELMTGKDIINILDEVEGNVYEKVAEQRRKIRAKVFPVLEDERMGVIVGKCWKGEYNTTTEVIEDLRTFLEGRGIPCGEDGGYCRF